MSSTFAMCKALTNLNLSSFDTSKVNRMDSMFIGSDNISNLDMSSFTTDANPNISNMFNSCNGLTNLRLDNFEFTKGTNPNIALSATFNKNTDIKVKNATEKAWFLSKYPTFTNVHE